MAELPSTELNALLLKIEEVSTLAVVVESAPKTLVDVVGGAGFMSGEQMVAFWSIESMLDMELGGFKEG